MKKLDIGATLSRVFDLYGKQAGVLLPAAFLVFLPVSLVSAVLVGVLGSALGPNPEDYAAMTPEQLNSAMGAASGSLAILGVVAAVLTIIGTFWYQGVIVEAVSDMQDGKRDLSVGDLFKTSAPFIPRLIGVAILVGLIFLAIGIVTILLSAAIAVTLGPLAILIPIVAFVLFIWLFVRWALLSPAIVAENAGATASFSRSSELVRGHWWSVFLIMLVLGIISYVAQLVIGLVLGGLGGVAVGTFLSSLVSATLTAPLLGIAAAIIFFSLRGTPDGGDTAVAPAAPAAPAPPAPTEPPAPPAPPAPPTV